MSKRILLVEDDLALRTGLLDSLKLEGYDLSSASNGILAEELIFSRHFDLVILDLMLPGKSGLDLLREMREQGLQTAVLILTARGDETDKVLGLELGADDYVSKPFGLRELIARVRALLRRGEHGKHSKNGGPSRFRIGESEIDLEAFQLLRDGERIALSPKEVKMLALLHAQSGKVVSRKRFLDEVWGASEYVGNRTIDTHILNLRKKLEENPAEPRFLLTVHGAGYKLADG